jgi:hypothetical protein
MATQRITVATIAGEAGQMVAGLFRKWHSTEGVSEQDAVRSAVDAFAKQLQKRGGIPPVFYYCEWFDCWLMGDSIHFGNVVEGKQFQASCGSRRDAKVRAEQNGSQFPEEQWITTRLQEAAEAWQFLAEPAVVVILRQVLGPTYTDEEVMASLSDANIFPDIAVNEM